MPSNPPRSRADTRSAGRASGSVRGSGYTGPHSAVPDGDAGLESMNSTERWRLCHNFFFRSSVSSYLLRQREHIRLLSWQLYALSGIVFSGEEGRAPRRLHGPRLRTPRSRGGGQSPLRWPRTLQLRVFVSSRFGFFLDVHVAEEPVQQVVDEAHLEVNGAEARHWQVSHCRRGIVDLQ
ncbi:hypothetical protein CTA1_13264 [Colletotrichum tanaceti]|uniref:Uncharacterized protein n=1 Tax=Colletotrichum tanaceti TaxID=1306861 RepID=A0A4U6XE08_9PEZI|nr:hypothetical protein CTA1_13264 [Colletotrichum tanaceti]